MKKILLAVAILFSFSTLAVAQHGGDRGGRQARSHTAGKQGAHRAAGPRRTAGVRHDRYRGSRAHYPHDRYGYRGRHNDRFPSDRYYWHSSHGRHYHRYYMPSHHWVMCLNGVRYAAAPGACVGSGGVMYFW